MTNSRARTWVARLIGGRGAAVLPGIAALVAACLVLEPGPAWAGPEAADGPSGRRVFSSGVLADTLDHDWRTVFPVAAARLEHDKWQIERSDTAARKVVTRWKPIDHVLTRLAFGDVMARCVVDLAPLRDGRTVIRMRGGLASEDDLEASPVWGAAQAAYKKAARKYLAGVRGALERASATAVRP
ncbi:MAG: hypothetical protein ABIP29_00700 [Candidatus Eisenbacteria bacterium]